MSPDAYLAVAWPEHRTALSTMARRLVPNRAGVDVDDLTQEGYIAAWRTTTNAEAARNPAAYLTTAARHRMVDVATGRTTTGTAANRSTALKARGEETRDRIRSVIAAHRRDHGTDPSQARIARALGLDPSTVSEQMRRMTVLPVGAVAGSTSLDVLVDEYGWDPTPTASDVLDEVALRYHYGQIHAAIDGLPDDWRRYVVDRFWGGMSEREAVARLPRRVRWADVRPILAERLAHLADAA